MKVITNYKEESTSISRLKELLENGEAKGVLGYDAEIAVSVDGIGDVVMTVLDYDRDKVIGHPEAHTITLWMRDLVLPKMKFDREECNEWKNSSVREYLNSEMFIGKFEEEFRNMIVSVEKNNDEREVTVDKFFLLSIDELGRGDAKNSEIKYAGIRNEKDRIKVDMDGETWSHWSRSASRGYSYYPWYVNSSGYVNGCYDASCALRVAPACVIAAI